MGKEVVRLIFIMPVDKILERYTQIYNIMDSIYACISCYHCRFYACRGEGKCFKWMSNELDVDIDTMDILIRSNNNYIQELIHRIARRLIGFGIAEMCQMR